MPPLSCIPQDRGGSFFAGVGVFGGSVSIEQTHGDFIGNETPAQG